MFGNPSDIVNTVPRFGNIYPLSITVRFAKRNLGVIFNNICPILLKLASMFYSKFLLLMLKFQLNWSKDKKFPIDVYGKTFICIWIQIKF